MKPSQKNNHRADKKNLVALIITVFSLSAIFTLFYFYLTTLQEHQNIDQNGCKKSGTPEKVVILIDHTDSINVIQKSSIETYLLDVAYSLGKYGALELYDVQNIINDNLHAKFTLCNPGNDKDVSSWTGNKQLARKKYEENFSDIIDHQLEDLLTAEQANNSPIMRSIQSIYVTALNGQKYQNVKKRLIIVSDLLEHTDAFSMYKNMPTFSEFKASAYWKQVKANLSGIHIEILYLNRPSANTIQSPALKQFWQYYFLEQGAETVKFVPIEG